MRRILEVYNSEDMMPVPIKGGRIVDIVRKEESFILSIDYGGIADGYSANR